MKKRVIVLILAIITLVSMLSACGGNQQASQQTNEQSGSQSASWDRIVRMAVAGAPYADPGYGADQVSNFFYVNCYDSLLYPDNNDKMQPMLAKEWNVSDDGLTYTFKLRDNVKFHDGTPLKASDVVYSAKRLLDTGKGYGYLFVDKIDTVTAPDDYTVVFKLKNQFAPFPALLCRLYILNEKLVREHQASGIYGDNGDYGEAWLSQGNEAGSGAYKLSAWNQMTSVVCTRFDDYWQPLDKDAPKGFELVQGTETATVRAKFESQQLEISDSWQTNENLKALSEIDGVEINSMAGSGVLFLQMNNKKPPLDDVHVRKALAYLIDYDQVSNVIFPGLVTDKSVIPVGMPGYTDQNITKYDYNVEKAKEELAQSKYKDTIGNYPINLTWIAEVPDEEKMALLIQAAAQPLGFVIEINKAPHMTNVENVSKLETTPHMNISVDVADYSEAGAMLDSRFSSKNVGRYYQTEWLQSAEFDKMIADAFATIDYDQRISKYEDITRWVMDNCICVPIGNWVWKHAYYKNKIDWPAANSILKGENVSKTDGYNFMFKDFRCLE